jgi:glyoxylase-like metal-dependent hydrolase (beta-lactamase superfamily II)
MGAPMIFRQLFDSTSGTYTYLLASRHGGEALIIDPVLEKVERYLQLVRELDLKLVKAVDTHLHADHVTGLGALRDRTHCITVMGEQTHADVVSMRVTEGDRIDIEGLSLDVLYTPGHTDDSYSYLLDERVFTGDTLLIRGTGRTDFQNGNARAQYDSIFNKLLKLPNETLVYPAHDYKGDTVSTIGEEKLFNPRLKVKSVDEYVDLMNNLKLPNPKMMDVAVPANMHVGLHQDEIARKGWAVSAAGGGGVARPSRRRDRRPAREGRTRQARHHSGLAARTLSKLAGRDRSRRHAARIGRGDRQPDFVLLRLWRTLGDGGAGGPGRRPQDRLSHRRRHRRLEESQRARSTVAAPFARKGEKPTNLPVQCRPRCSPAPTR